LYWKHSMILSLSIYINKNFVFVKCLRENKMLFLDKDISHWILYL
jgi:hypothetical protein